MPWQDEIKAIWEEIRDARRRSSRVRLPVPDGRAADDEFELYPYLECSSVYYRSVYYRPRFPRRDGYVGRIMTRPPGISWSPKITVWNSGTFPAWTCHVEVRENPGDILKAQTIITLKPSESRDVILPVTTGQDGTSLLGICYDPLLDPYDPQDPSGRKVTPLALIGTWQATIRVNARDNVARRLLQPE